MFVDSAVINQLTTKTVLVKINAEVDTLAKQKYGVMGYPTVIVADANGKEFDRIVGYLPPADFLQTVGDYQAGKGTLDAKLAEAKKDKSPILAKEIAEKYKYRGDDKNAEQWYQQVLASVKPNDTLAAMIRIDMADMYRRMNAYDKALTAFMSIEKDFAGTPYAADAAVYTGIVQARKGDTTAALMTYNRYLQSYPNGSDTDYVRTQIQKLTKK